MVEELNAQEIISSSPKKGGARLGTWRADRIFLASKTCQGCGTTFKPWIKRAQDGKIKSAMPEHLWKKQRYCSVRCAKRSHPTALDAQARKKISNRLKEIRHSPIQRGGNGRLLPLPQLALLHALGDGWMAEYSIKTNAGHLNGTYPNAYKADIANPALMIVIELDGGSHSTLQRQEQDRKKTQCLAALGWSVYRVSNERALHLYSTFKSVDILLTSLME